MQTRLMGSPIKVNPTKCTGCLTCELRCSLRFERGFQPALAAIQVRRQVAAYPEYAISFTPRCDNCGICARFCSYGCLTQDKNGEEVA